MKPAKHAHSTIAVLTQIIVANCPVLAYILAQPTGNNNVTRT